MVQLDGIRALAIAAVIWSHWVPGRYHLGIPWGTGVQLFFVLSGFLITGILIRNRQEKSPLRVWKRFYTRRFLRIFPLFYLTLAVTLLLNVAPIRDTWPWHVSYLSNFLYVWGPGVAADPFRHFWSLAVEEQFYLIWPFFALLLSLRQLGWVLLSLIIAAPVLRMAMVFFVADHSRIHFLSWSSYDALGIGGFLAYLMHLRSLKSSGAIEVDSRSPLESEDFSSGKPSLEIAKPAGWDADRVGQMCLLIGIPVCLVGIVLERLAGESHAIHSIGHTGLILFYGWVVLRAAKGFKGWVGTLLSNRILVYVGKISYGLYVFHNLAPTLTRFLASCFDLPGALPFTFLLNAFITLGLAIISWHCFERPLNDLKRFFPYK